eukprot:scaffold238798_cov26-Tisochrysis_lutea.AAC.3
MRKLCLTVPWSRLGQAAGWQIAVANARVSSGRRSEARSWSRAIGQRGSTRLRPRSRAAVLRTDVMRVDVREPWPIRCCIFEANRGRWVRGHLSELWRRVGEMLLTRACGLRLQRLADREKSGLYLEQKAR